jgi:hypothetical protein
MTKITAMALATKPISFHMCIKSIAPLLRFWTVQNEFKFSVACGLAPATPLRTNGGAHAPP